MNVPNVNAHLHTPYSFSAFSDLTQALDMAVNDGVSVVGINDFYTTAGYEAWANACKERHLHPLFNIEFISLNEADQQAGLRVNDPGNPGRTYLSGKGLMHPLRLTEPYASQLNAVREAANNQVALMCAKLNEVLDARQAGFQLDFDWIREHLTKGSIRERHLAKALRIKLYETLGTDEAAIRGCFERLFGGKPLTSALTDEAGVENEIRGNLLKAGGAAFVPEEATAFLPMEQVCRIILAAGGIPTYPFLADDAKGGYTDFEGDLEKVARVLTERDFASVEFISTRNDLRLLETYAIYLHEQGFVVTLGSEHNTPAMEPILLTARGGEPLSDTLKRINYEGACVIAAHQHVVAQGLSGYVTPDGRCDRSRRDEYVQLGDQLIQTTIRHESH